MNAFEEKYAAFLARAKRPGSPNRNLPTTWHKDFHYHRATKHYTCWRDESHRIQPGDAYLDAGTTTLNYRHARRRFCATCAGIQT